MTTPRAVLRKHTATAPRRSADRVERLASALVAVTALVAYLALAPRVSGDGDGSELTLVLASNGIAHPTGYPLYCLFGHLFGRAVHALGADWPYAANAWSAVGAATALFCMHRLICELMRGSVARGVRLVASLVPVLVLACNPIWTNEAMLAEVYSWHIAWVLGATWLGVRLLQRGAGGDTAINVFGWGLVVGAGLAHHLTSLLVSVPFTFALASMLARQRRLQPRLMVVTLAGLLLPLTGYVYMAWRAGHPSGYQWPLLEPSVRSVIAHATGSQYRHFFGSFAPNPKTQELLATACYPILVPGIVMLVVLALRSRGLEARTLSWCLVTAAALVTAVGFSYGVSDPAPYFLPAMALGLVALAPVVVAPVRRRANGAAAWIYGGTVAVGLALLLVLWTSKTLARRQEIVESERVIRAMWEIVPDAPGFVFWAEDRYALLREYQMLRGEKPELYVEHPEQLLNEPVRQRFVARFGFDPLRGLQVPTLAPGAPGNAVAISRSLARMIHNVNEQTPLPVMTFDPTTQEVLRLNKPKQE